MYIVQLSFKRIFRILFLRLQAHNIFPGAIRYRLLKLSGVKISKTAWVGGGNLFDTIRPDLITIGDHTTISTRCIVLTHFVQQNKVHRKWSYGEVRIGNNCFLGANVIIPQPISIGDNSVIAAGAVVTKDIPSGEVWGGVPAKFIKKVNEQD